MCVIVCVRKEVLVYVHVCICVCVCASVCMHARALVYVCVSKLNKNLFSCFLKNIYYIYVQRSTYAAHICISRYKKKKFSSSCKFGCIPVCIFQDGNQASKFFLDEEM